MTDEDREIRKHFPIFEANPDLHYLDNSATSQRPVEVLDAVTKFYETVNSNPMRGLYDISLRATEQYEEARTKVANFINAKDSSEIVFTRNATESLNQIAYSYGENFIKEGDEIIVSIAEHHSNMLPWQQVAKKTGATLKYFYCEKDGEFSLEKFKELLTPNTKLVAMTEMSNLFGRKNDVKAFAAEAHKAGAVFVADGAQSAPHIKVDVQDSDIDFFAFSGHKMYAPMGIGVLYAKKDLLEKMPPFLFGGEMIEYVTIEGATYAEVPHKFEAGTVNAGGAVGLCAALDFINSYGLDFLEKREEELTKYAVERILEVPHVTLIGSEDYREHHGILTFKIDGVHPHDVAAIMDSAHVAIRAGHHCAQPLHKYLGVMSTSRMSLGFYNTKDDIDAFIDCLSSMRSEMGYKD